MSSQRPPYKPPLRSLTPPDGSKRATSTSSTRPLFIPRVPPPPLSLPPSYEEDEIPTVRKGEAVITYQEILSIFDSMSPAERLEFIEMATVFRDLSSKDRAYLVEEANNLAKLQEPSDPKASL